MKISILALLVGAFVFLAPASSQAYGIADTLRYNVSDSGYNNAPKTKPLQLVQDKIKSLKK